MHLEAIEITNYRSISKATLEPCGDFNVLIGRNNSGKSNILGSIDSFFSSIKPEAIDTSPPIGDEIDFFQKNFANQISIKTVVRLSDDERKILLTEISEERPQVKNLLESIDQDVRLAICISINPPPKKFAFIHSILLLTPTREPQTLFELDNSAADELHEIIAGAERAESSKISINRFIQSFDSEDYANARRNRSREIGGPPLEYHLRRYGEMDARLLAELVKLFHASENYESFLTSVTQLSKSTEATQGELLQRPINRPIRTFSGDEFVVPQYVKRFLERLKNTKILHFKERRVPIGSDEAKRLLSLKIKRGGTDILDRIQSTIDELLGVKVDAFEGPTGPRGQSTAELDVDQFLIQANGSGIREALRLILDTEFEKPDMLLVEEPEIHLHPALETSVMSYLREISQSNQVFITTHSTNFLDTGNFQNVFLVQKKEATRVSPLTLAEAEEKLPSELGIRLSSLFMYDQIIFVEGPSDEQIVREFARILNLNLGQLNVGFIQMRGVRNLGHYATAEVVTFLTKRQVKLRFLVDSDESESVHFRRLRDEFGPAAQIHVLAKREIENYLLSPAANIRHLINRKRLANDRAFTPPDEEIFRGQEEDCAERLKSVAIWKRLMSCTGRPFYPKDGGKETPSDKLGMTERVKMMLEEVRRAAEGVIADVDRVFDEAAATVEMDWATRKMNIVPGSAILDAVYQLYGFRYDKMRDGIGVVSQMTSQDIDQEVRGFIQAIGQSRR